MISYDEAIALIEQNLPNRGEVAVLLGECLGRTTSQELLARDPSPRFDNSRVDGYALGPRSGDSWLIVESVPAGQLPSRELQIGEAARIFTGTSLPKGTVSVAMQEYARVTDDRVSLTEPVAEGENVRRKGEAVEAGSLLVSAGSAVNPASIGAAASDGRAAMRVASMPRVALVITGSELMTPGEPLRDAHIYDSNSPAIRAALEAIGCEVAMIRVQDELEQTIDAIRLASVNFDLILTVGGVSVGDFDFAPRAAVASGFKPVFQGVRMRPGKPVSCGLHPDGKAWFGLPGNPESALVTLVLFVFRYLRRPLVFRSIPLAHEYVYEAQREEFLPAKLRVEGAFSVDLKPSVGSHSTVGLVEAHGLVRLPIGSARLAAGTPVEFAKLPWSDPW